MAHIPVTDLVSAILPGTATERVVAVGVFKNKWQMLLWDSLNIPEVDKNDEQAYSYEANLLIAYLICRDLLSSIVLDQISLSVLSSQGGIKKIVTGPTEVERYSVADGVKDLFKPNGIWETFLNQICSLANLLGVYISGCSGSPSSTVSVLRGSDYSYDHQAVVAPQFDKKP